MRSKNEVKKIDTKIFTSICRQIKNKDYPLAYKDWSKQRLNYRLNKFEDLGLIEKTFRSTCQHYRLTPQSKNFLIGHDKRHLMRLHHAQFHFDVHSWGQFPMTCQKTLVKGFKNNPYFHRKYRGLKFRFFTDADSFEVYSPKGGIYCNEEASGIAKLTQRVYRAVQDLVDRYDMEVDMGRISRKPHFAIVKNPFTRTLKSYMDNKGVDVDLDPFELDDSLGDGEGEFETPQPFKMQQFLNSVRTAGTLSVRLESMEHQINKRFENVYEKIAKLLFAIEQLTDVMTKFTGGVQ